MSHLLRTNQSAVDAGHPLGIDARRQQVSHQPLVDAATQHHLHQRQRIGIRNPQAVHIARFDIQLRLQSGNLFAAAVYNDQPLITACHTAGKLLQEPIIIQIMPGDFECCNCLAH